MRKFLITYPDSSISIVTVLDGSTNEEIINKSTKYLANSSYRDVTDADIPNEHKDFRQAWVDEVSGSQIDVCHGRSHALALAELRYERDLELHRLDKLKVWADEINDTTLSASIATDKQALRDATEDLKAMTPSGHNNEYTLDEIRDKKQLPAINN